MPGDGEQPPREPAAPGPRPGRPPAPAGRRPPGPPGTPAKKRKKQAAPRPEGAGPTGPRPPAARPQMAPAKKRPPGAAPPGKKAPGKKAPAEKRPPGSPPPGKKAPAKKRPPGSAPPGKEAPAKKAPGKKAPAKKRPPGSAPPGKKAPSRRPRPDADSTAAVPAADLLPPAGTPRARVETVPPGSAPVVPELAPEPDSWGTQTVAPAAPPRPASRPTGDPSEVVPPPGYKIGRDGKPKKLRGKAKRIYKARTRPPSRFLNYYDVNGPRIRLGFLWFLTLAAAIAAETGTDLPVLAVVYGTAAGFGGWQAAREWRKRTESGPVEWAAAVIGLMIGLAAAVSAGAVGVAVLASVGVAAAAGVTDERARQEYVGNVGLTLQCGLFVGIAAVAPALTWRVEPGAAIALVLLVSAYEVGDYVVGSGSLNAFEGPVAGIAAVIALMMPMYAVQLPPINPDTALTYALIICIGCPLGQLVGSAVLPWSDAPAPAVRRLDSLMVAGPAWLIALWIENSLL